MTHLGGGYLSGAAAACYVHQAHHDAGEPIALSLSSPTLPSRFLPISSSLRNVDFTNIHRTVTAAIFTTKYLQSCSIYKVQSLVMYAANLCLAGKTETKASRQASRVKKDVNSSV